MKFMHLHSALKWIFNVWSSQLLTLLKKQHAIHFDMWFKYTNFMCINIAHRYISLWYKCHNTDSPRYNITADSLGIMESVLRNQFFAFSLNKIQLNTHCIFSHLLTILWPGFWEFRQNFSYASWENINWNSLLRALSKDTRRHCEKFAEFCNKLLKTTHHPEFTI